MPDGSAPEPNGRRVRMTMVMRAHVHKRIDNTSSLHPSVCLSGAVARVQLRPAPRLELRVIYSITLLTWHAQLKTPILNLMMGQGEHAQAYSSPSDRRRARRSTGFSRPSTLKT